MLFLINKNCDYWQFAARWCYRKIINTQVVIGLHNPVCNYFPYTGGMRKGEGDELVVWCHLLDCVVKTPSTAGLWLICITFVKDCRTSKQKNESPGTEQFSRALRNDVQYRSRTLGDPPLSFLHTRPTLENTTQTKKGVEQPVKGKSV